MRGALREKWNSKSKSAWKDGQQATRSEGMQRAAQVVVAMRTTGWQPRYRNTSAVREAKRRRAAKEAFECRMAARRLVRAMRRCKGRQCSCKKGAALYRR